MSDGKVKRSTNKHCGVELKTGMLKDCDRQRKLWRSASVCKLSGIDSMNYAIPSMFFSEKKCYRPEGTRLLDFTAIKIPDPLQCAIISSMNDEVKQIGKTCSERCGHTKPQIVGMDDTIYTLTFLSLTEHRGQGTTNGFSSFFDFKKARICFKPSWHKRTTLRRNIKVGNLVLIFGEQHKCSTWLKEIVTATIPGSDGCVRTVVFKTPDGSVARDIRNMCMLEEVSESRELSQRREHERLGESLVSGAEWMLFGKAKLASMGWCTSFPPVKPFPCLSLLFTASTSYTRYAFVTPHKVLTLDTVNQFGRPFLRAVS
ncbi:hypothetical protein CLF_102531 [Clonorchis sinensis]|uniref:DUF5641 domain-containing protein n=1 Tax=Clonorchis sinensis TaxID=79923 RepID=G7YN39_CLOSI|nr:hypothetical protein CLF_102531 [Clonorchis sinensis]